MCWNDQDSIGSTQEKYLSLCTSFNRFEGSPPAPVPRWNHRWFNNFSDILCQGKVSEILLITKSVLFSNKSIYCKNQYLKVHIKENFFHMTGAWSVEKYAISFSSITQTCIIESLIFNNDFFEYRGCFFF